MASKHFPHHRSFVGDYTDERRTYKGIVVYSFDVFIFVILSFCDSSHKLRGY